MSSTEGLIDSLSRRPDRVLVGARMSARARALNPDPEMRACASHTLREPSSEEKGKKVQQGENSSNLLCHPSMRDSHLLVIGHNPSLLTCPGRERLSILSPGQAMDGGRGTLKEKQQPPAGGDLP